MTTRKRADKIVARSRQVNPSGKTSKTPAPVYGASTQMGNVGPRVYNNSVR
jgi:hypothetical protein